MAGDAGVAFIAFGPGETVEEATARYFAQRPPDRTMVRTICVNTGVPRSVSLGGVALLDPISSE